MSNIINITPGEPQDIPVFEVIGGSGCKHTHSLIDAKSRVITCRDCESILDPVDVILQIANSEGTKRKRLDELNKEVSKTQKAYTDMKVILRKRSRYKCRHCDKYSEATPNIGWGNEVKSVNFSRIDEK